MLPLRFSNAAISTESERAGFTDAEKMDKAHPEMWQYNIFVILLCICRVRSVLVGGRGALDPDPNRGEPRQSSPVPANL